MGSQEARQGPPALGVDFTDDTIDERRGQPGVWVEQTMKWQPSAAGRPADVGPVATAPGRIIVGRYRLGTLLGTGGMGSVWLAEDVVLQRAVALKQLKNHDRESRPAALKEARAAARVTHTGVVRVYDIVHESDEDWIVMEALSGEPLSAIIRERGRLPVHEVTQIAVELLSGLRAIHDADLVHRDMKPGNVQVCRDGRVVITDFGLSSPGGMWGGLRVGAVAGSPSYMAPETFIAGVFGPASDLYALGVTLYMALEGRPPFESGGQLGLLDAVLSAQPEPARHAGCLAGLLHGLLDKDPEQRMDAARVGEYLEAIALVPTT